MAARAEVGQRRRERRRSGDGGREVAPSRLDPTSGSAAARGAADRPAGSLGGVALARPAPPASTASAPPQGEVRAAEVATYVAFTGPASPSPAGRPGSRRCGTGWSWARPRSGWCCWPSPPARSSPCRCRAGDRPHRLTPDGGHHGPAACRRPARRRRRLPGPASAPLVVGLFLLGLANGAWDVAMNVQGAVVEQRLGRSIMSRFHAGFSLGTVAGALLGAAMVALRVSVTAHLASWLVVVAGRGRPSLVARASCADRATAPPTRAPIPPRRARRARGLARAAHAADRALRARLRLRRGLRQRLDQRRAHRRLRRSGRPGDARLRDLPGRDDGRALVRPRRARPVRPGAGRPGAGPARAAGLLLFVLAPTTPLAFAGALLWGLGISLGFPVGMSARRDEPALAAGRVSAIASIGYCAFLPVRRSSASSATTQRAAGARRGRRPARAGGAGRRLGPAAGRRRGLTARARRLEM